MKPISNTLIALLLCMTTAVSHAQTTKSVIFSGFPETIDCLPSEFNAAFNANEGQTISLHFSNNFIITGKVISKIRKYSNLESITMRVPQYADAVFHLSRQTNDDHSISFVGRILSTESFDGYEIKRDAAGNYKLHKVEEEKIRQVCSF
ncbi:MAG: hypothetical protein ABIP80_05415 [Ferruginibacter sp.]